MAQDIAIVDYGSGNLRSAAKAFAVAAEQTQSAYNVHVTDDPKIIANADRIVLPGVGAFADCRNGLYARPGLLETISEAVLKDRKPFLGICVGMQLLADMGHEHGEHKGLGWIGGHVTQMTAAPDKKIPHMGWNTLSYSEAGKTHPILRGIPPDAQVYFVHSFAFETTDPAHVLATTSYGGNVNAIIGHDNIIGTQFHPEKSQAVGLRIIQNFLTWTPAS